MNYHEKKYLREIVARAISDGCMVSVDDGEDNPITLSRDDEAIMSHLGHCEEERLILHTNNSSRKFVGSIYLVYGNEPDELVCDYSWDNTSTHGESRMKAIVGEYKA